MACLSPSPSGRRLSELLEEKQEPFSLDLHLLEKGCSSRLLDAYDDTTALCWPAAGNDAAAVVLRRLTTSSSNRNNNKAKKPAAAGGGGNNNSNATNKKKKKKPAGGILQLLLSKILRGRAAAQRKPAALQCSESFKMAAAVAPSPRSDDDQYRLLEAKQQQQQDAAECYCSDCDDDSEDDEKQQLSPVSVLPDHPFETSPTHGGKLSSSSPSKNAAMDVFRELLDAAYSPALLTQLLARTDDLLREDAAAAADEGEGDGDSCYRDDESAAYWDAHRAELARVSKLVASEVPAPRRLTPADVRPERQDVAAEVEAAVLEALMRELLADLGSSC